MTSKTETAKKQPQQQQGNLGQKEAQQQQRGESELAHMGDAEKSKRKDEQQS
jgi:hypothetical protein